MISNELIPCFTLHVYAAYVLPSKLSFSQPMSSCMFTFLILSPFHLREHEWVAEWVSECGAQLSAGIKKINKFKKKNKILVWYGFLDLNKKVAHLFYFIFFFKVWFWDNKLMHKE